MAKQRRKRLDWLKFVPSDFLHGTKEMTNEEVGAYIRLLCEAWLNSVNGTVIPNVPYRTSAILAALPGTAKKDWERVRRTVLSKFKLEVVDIKGQAIKVLTNHRLTNEQQDAIGESETQKQRALKRYYGNAPVMPGHTPGNAAVVPKEVEREGETDIQKELAAKGGQSGSQEGTVAKEKALHKTLARTWQEILGSDGATCPYPYFNREQFEDLARLHGHDVIADAFKLWAQDCPTPERERNPIDKFVMNSAEYMLKARPPKAPDDSGAAAAKANQEAFHIKLVEQIREQESKQATPAPAGMSPEDFLATE